MKKVENKQVEKKTMASSANLVRLNAIQKKAVSVIQQESKEQAAQQHKSTQHKENKTGLPDNLKSGIENLSGMSMDHVKVHYNSSQPAQLNALAYAQGSDIHIAPGQEKHLAHEAWHVVQQAQGRVQPTTQMQQGVAVNDDPGLEQEADVMGAKAVNAGRETTQLKSIVSHSASDVVQCVPSIQQPKSNQCWAACGYAIHLHKGGNAVGLENFVQSNGTKNAVIAFANNQVFDIDGLIGESSKINYFNGGYEAKAGIPIKDIDGQLSGNPIVACIGAKQGGHYVILESCKINDEKTEVSFSYMDPDKGSSVSGTSKLGKNGRIYFLNGHKIFMIYFTK